MSQTKIISEITPEQEALIPLYREKWRAMAITYRFTTILSTEPNLSEKRAETVRMMELAEPRFKEWNNPQEDIYNAEP